MLSLFNVTESKSGSRKTGGGKKWLQKQKQTTMAQVEVLYKVDHHCLYDLSLGAHFLTCLWTEL